ncbi:GNAT family N-acetyltransferase [Pseudomonas sp. NA13]
MLLWRLVASRGGADRLLRSLVVLEGQRGKGAGAAVLAAIEAFAKREGVERLHLLTDSAAAFLPARAIRHRTARWRLLRSVRRPNSKPCARPRRRT